jgi:hypothetical protein
MDLGYNKGNYAAPYGLPFSDVSDEEMISATQAAEQTYNKPSVSVIQELAEARKIQFSDVYENDEMLISATQEAEKLYITNRFGQPVSEAEVLSKSRKRQVFVYLHAVLIV